MKKYLFLLGWIGLAVKGYAGGFQLNLQGSAQAGMGGTGVAMAQNNAILYYNPAALVHYKYSGFSYHGALVSANSTFTPAQNPSGFERTANPLGTPFSAYLSTRCHSCGDSSKWAAGIAIYTPFGAKMKWSDDWMGKFILQNISLKTIFVQPTMSLLINKFLSVGVGSVVGYGSMELNKALPLYGANANPAAVKLTATGNGIGFLVGLYYTITQNWHAGFVLRTPVGMAFNGGKAAFTNIPNAVIDSFPNTNFATAFFLPGSATVGASWQANQRLTLSAEAQLAFWNTYDSLRVKFAKHTALLQDIHTPKRYGNCWTYRIGAQYEYRKFAFRAGLVYDQSPIKPEYLGPDVPDANKLEGSVGLGYKRNKIGLNVFTTYVQTAARSFTNTETNLNGTLQTTAFIIGAGVSYSY